MLRNVFIAVATKYPQMHDDNSRAVYGIDIMIDSETMEPKLLEITFSPDCKRACEYYPTFYDDVFHTLFLETMSDSMERIIWSELIILKIIVTVTNWKIPSLKFEYTVGGMERNMSHQTLKVNHRVIGWRATDALSAKSPTNNTEYRRVIGLSAFSSKNLIELNKHYSLIL